MKIVYRGHASFVIETNGKTIITDPYNGSYGYPINPVKADIVTVSHEHNDHNAIETIQGQPLVVKGPFINELEGINFYGFKSFHDRSEGRQRGQNTIFKIKSEDLRVVHLGDLGIPLTAGQVDEIGPVDILMVPVGGTYTVNAAEARQVVDSLQPKIVIPMHYKTVHCNLSIEPVDKFAGLFKKVEHLPFLEIQSEELLDQQRVVVLDYNPT